MSVTWNTSTTEILTIFRDAILALIPTFEKAKIAWKEGEAYDDFDNIVEALYSNIVCSSLTGEVASQYNMPRYCGRYNYYASMDFIEVKNGTGKRFAFIAYQTEKTPFDIIQVAELDEAGKVIGYSNVKFEGATFIFIKNNNGRRDHIDNIEVVL